jgi:hypothetical protein
MNILAILLSLFLGTALYWYLNPLHPKDKKCGRVLLIYDQFVYSVDVTLREAHESWEDFMNRAKRDNLGKWVAKQTEN